MSVSSIVSASSASSSSSTSVQAPIDVDEDFVADADLIAASVIDETIPSTSYAHLTNTSGDAISTVQDEIPDDSTLVHDPNSDIKNNITGEEQVVASMVSVSINELQNVTGHDDDGDNDDEQVTHDQAIDILEWGPVPEQQISTNAEGDENVTHDQVIDILEWEPVPKQQISTNTEGQIDVLNDNMEHANIDQEMNVSCSENTETYRSRANVGKVKRKIFNN